MNYFVNYRLYNGLPCNNYYTKIDNGITKYYSELLFELNDDEIKKLGIDTLTIINDIPMNITDFINTETKTFNGGSKKMIGGAKKVMKDPDLIKKIVNENIATINSLSSESAVDKYKNEEFYNLFNYTNRDFNKVLNDVVITLTKDPKMTWNKYMEKVKNSADIRRDWKKTVLLAFLEKQAENNGIYEEIESKPLDLVTINLSNIMTKIPIKDINRGFSVQVSNSQKFDYEVKLDATNINRVNDAVDEGDILYCLLKNIYPLLIQSNPNNKIKAVKIVEHNNQVFQHIIDTGTVLNEKYIIDASFKTEKFKNETPVIDAIGEAFVKADNTSTFQKYMYFFNKVVRCLNKYCFRPAKSGATATTTKQRQECKECDAYRKEFYENDGVHIASRRPQGIEIFADPFGNNFKFRCVVKDVDLIYEKFCYNNRNINYWTGLKDRAIYVRGVARGLLGVQYDENMESILYYDKKSEQNEHLSLPVYDEEKKDVVNRQYLCELDRSWDAYPSDITEIDHISGNHQDNRPENIQPLCKTCHAIKTKLAQDKAETGTTISAIDAYFAGLVKDTTKYNKICGFFYLQYSLFCDKIKFVDTLIGKSTKYTLDLIEPPVDIITIPDPVADPTAVPVADPIAVPVADPTTVPVAVPIDDPATIIANSNTKDKVRAEAKEKRKAAPSASAAAAPSDTDLLVKKIDERIKTGMYDFLVKSFVKDILPKYRTEYLDFIDIENMRNSPDKDRIPALINFANKYDYKLPKTKERSLIQDDIHKQLITRVKN
jgi:hypothetical protein